MNVYGASNAGNSPNTARSSRTIFSSARGEPVGIGIAPVVMQRDRETPGRP